jgi:hypothetical protein
MKPLTGSIPKCLRRLPIWFVTERRGDPGSIGFNRYSAVTLSTLEYDRASDYACLDDAIQAWQDHRHWLDGVAFRVTNPWVVLVIQNCLTSGGNLLKRVRNIIKHVGGYWEVTKNGQDIQGIFWCPQKQASRAGFIAGHPAFLCGEGVCAVSGSGLKGLTSDPLQTDIDALGVVLGDMVVPKAGRERLYQPKTQLTLF